MLCTFLSQLRTHPVILASPRDARIIKYLRNLLKRQRKLFSTQPDPTARASLCTQQNAIPHQPHLHQQQQQDDHAAATSPSPLSSVSSPWSKRRYNDLNTPLSSSSSSTITASSSTSSPAHLPKSSHDYWTRLLNQRKDSGIGIPHHGGKELRSSTSTPILPFLGRTRRLSTCSQRSVHEENAWTAKMNFGIKTIKRTVPSVYYTIVHGIATTTNQNHQHRPRQASSSPNNNKCTCKKQQPQHQHNSTFSHSLPHRYPKSAIMRSASRLFEKQKPASSTRSSPLASSNFRHPFDTLSYPCHTDSACPYYTPPVSSSFLGSTDTAQQQSRISHYSSTRDTFDTDSLHDTYKPFILAHRSEIIAQQFCMLEQAMLQNVTWDELTELRWRKRSKGTVISPDTEQGLLQDGVEQMIGFFNKVDYIYIYLHTSCFIKTLKR